MKRSEAKKQFHGWFYQCTDGSLSLAVNDICRALYRVVVREQLTFSVSSERLRSVIILLTSNASSPPAAPIGTALPIVPSRPITPLFPLLSFAALRACLGSSSPGAGGGLSYNRNEMNHRPWVVARKIIGRKTQLKGSRRPA